MNEIIDDLGGTSAVARMCSVRPPSVSEWRVRGIPVEHCPTIERESNGKHQCEVLRDDVVWARIPDKSWPWNKRGRPVLDLSKAAG